MEIEFRAWDEDNKKMLYIEPLQSWFRFMTWDGHCFKEGKHLNYRMMQYIGEQDKKGRKIFVGDLVLRKDSIWTKGKESIGLIIFSNAKFGVALISGDEWSFLDPDGETFSWNDLCVIGNIFEDKQILDLKDNEYLDLLKLLM